MRNDVIEHHFRKNYKKQVGYITNRVPNKSHALAEEVVQEAYARALKYFDGFDPKRSAFSTWFNRILNNACSACMQEEAGHPQEYIEEQELEPHRLMEELEVPFELVVLIQEEMKAKPDDRREVLHMFFNLGMKTREIAECVEFSHTNIRQIIRRFRIKFDENSVKLV